MNVKIFHIHKETFQLSSDPFSEVQFNTLSSHHINPFFFFPLRVENSSSETLGLSIVVPILEPQEYIFLSSDRKLQRIISSLKLDLVF